MKVKRWYAFKGLQSTWKHSLHTPCSRGGIRLSGDDKEVILSLTINALCGDNDLTTTPELVTYGKHAAMANTHGGRAVKRFSPRQLPGGQRQLGFDAVGAGVR